MDTILFFYRKRGLQEPEIEPVGLKTYLLIRIGLDVDAGQWFGRRLEEMPLQKSADAATGSPVGAKGDIDRAGKEAWEPPGGSGKRGAFGPDWTGERIRESEEGRYRLGAVLCHPWKALRQRREKKKRQRRERAWRREWEQEKTRRLAEREQLLIETEMAIRRLALEVEELAGGWRDCYCVYEDNIRKTIIKKRNSGHEYMPQREDTVLADSPLPELWRKYFPLEEFSGYRQQFWVEQLFPRAVLPHFILLGKAEGIFDAIESCARGMKSLRWILTEAEYDEELAAFAEDFYTEYGLAIELQLLEDAAALKRLRFFCKEAVNVVDFTGEAYMAVSALPEGSIWLDMLSVEEKRRRIMARGNKITYVSMKEIWKSAQKRCTCPIVP